MSRYSTGSVENLLKNLSDLAALGERLYDPLPYQVISGSGHGYYLDPAEKRMIRTTRGVEVVVISDKEDKKGRVLVRVDHRFLLIPKDEVIDVGFN